MKIDYNKVPDDAIYLFLEILDKADINIFELEGISEDMDVKQAGVLFLKVIMKNLKKVRVEVLQLLELVTGRESDGSVGWIISAIQDISGVEDLKSFFM